MPSIQDVADQINARLDQINTHTSSTSQNTAGTLDVAKAIRTELVQANANLNKIDQTLQIGFGNLSQGLFLLTQIQLAALNLLDHHRKQNDAILCELANNNVLLCNIMRKFNSQLELSESQLTATLHIEGIAERVSATESGDYQRHLETLDRIEQCCPPECEPEERCPEPCKVPAFRATKPDGKGWQPLPALRPNPTKG